MNLTVSRCPHGLAGVLVLCLGAGQAALPAQAAEPTTCPAPSALERLPEGSALATLVETWRQWLNECQNVPAYLVLLGRALNALGQHEEAAEHLERALLLDPSDTAAQEAFAVALLGLGDPAGARDVLRSLLAAHPTGTPGASAQQLRTQINQLEALLRPGTPTLAQQQPGRGRPNGGHQSPPHTQTPAGTLRTPGGGLLAYSASATALAGAERNLLGASVARNLTLTLPGLNPGDVVLITVPVDESFRPRSGSYRQAQLGAQASALWPAGETRRWEWEAQGALRQRQVPGLQAAGFTQSEWATEARLTPAAAPATHATAPSNPGTEPPHSPWARWVQEPGAYLAASYNHLSSRTGVEYRSSGAAIGRLGKATPEGRCEWRAGLEGQWRQYLSNPTLDGRYRGLQGQWACGTPAESTAPWQPQSWQLTLRHGHDAPEQTTRPGGEQRQTLLRAQARGTPTAKGQWSLDMEAARLTDETGYSPLIEQNATRSVQRFAARLEWAGPLHAASGLAWFAAAEGFRQNSNLNLFKSNNLGGFIGIRITK